MEWKRKSGIIYGGLFQSDLNENRLCIDVSEDVSDEKSGKMKHGNSEI